MADEGVCGALLKDVVAVPWREDPRSELLPWCWHLFAHVLYFDGVGDY